MLLVTKQHINANFVIHLSIFYVTRNVAFSAAGFVAVVSVDERDYSPPETSLG